MSRPSDRPKQGTIPLLIDCLYSLPIDERKRFISKMLDIPIGQVFDITTDYTTLRFKQIQEIVDIVKNFNLDPNLPLGYDILVNKYGKPELVNHIL